MSCLHSSKEITPTETHIPLLYLLTLPSIWIFFFAFNQDLQGVIVESWSGIGERG